MSLHKAKQTFENLPGGGAHLPQHQNLTKLQEIYLPMLLYSAFFCQKILIDAIIVTYPC